MIFTYLLISLSLTLIIELTIARINKISLKYAIMVNIITNPTTVILYYWAYSLNLNLTITIIILEICVILAEYILYKGIHKRPLLFSIIVNLSSFGIGFILQNCIL